MRMSAGDAWERMTDRAIGWCGYVLLALATALAAIGHLADAGWMATTLGLVAAAAAWIYLLYTRMPEPRSAHRVRILVFVAGFLVLAAVLMVRQPAVFIFMIAGFFYASLLPPLPLAVLAGFATSLLANPLTPGPPQSPEAATFYVAIIVVQTLVLGGGVVVGEKVAEQNEERKASLARLEVALVENAGLHAQLLAQAREAGVLDERSRMAREIHDTIAQGLIGIVTQLEAATQARDRAADHARHIENAQRLARESLVEARRSVEASTPAALESGTLAEALKAVARQWSELHSVPVDVTVTGEVI